MRSDPVSIRFTDNPDVSRIANLSIRAAAGSDEKTLIVGASLGGGADGSVKPLVIRGIGPTLRTFNVTNALPGTSVTLLKGSDVMATNAQWDGAAATTAVFDAVGAFHLPIGSKDAVLLQSLPAGLYSVMVGSPTGAAGVALAEIYDRAPSSWDPTKPRLINVSARCQVGTGNDILIAGFAIVGSTPKTVLIRGVGPSLSAFGVPGVLGDPQLELRTTAGELVAANDNWGGTQVLRDAFKAVGAFDLSTLATQDAALVVTLPPGAYTAQVRGAHDSTGVALVEVYEIP